MAKATLGVLLLVGSLLSGCAAPGPRSPRDYPPGDPLGWDVEAPEFSRLADVPYYELSQSSTFLLKGATYGRYVIRVDDRFPVASVFFTSTNHVVPGLKRPNVADSQYHYEFMQVRRLGQTVQSMDVNAQAAFSHANTGHTLTLAYIYGAGANHQYLVPYEGNPARWTLAPGFYELVIATDEKLTVGINVRVGTVFWTTHYHPQELGASRIGSLKSMARGWQGGVPRTLVESFDSVVAASKGETLNYFVFSDLIYRANVAAVDAHGTASVRVDDKYLPHRLQTSGAFPTGAELREAYAYAVSFAEPGPVSHRIRTSIDFQEVASVDSDMWAEMLVFAIVLRPQRTTADLPVEQA